VHKRGYAPSSGICYDSVPSSYFLFNNDSTSIHEGNNPWVFGTLNIEFNYADKIPFIPSSSAFCFPDYNRDFYLNPVSPRSQTPFDSYIVSNTNSGHTSYYITDISDWLTDVMAEINVPPVLFNGDLLTVNEAASSFTWTSSSTEIATVNHGVVSTSGNGTVTFTASAASPGRVVSKTRKAIVGYPQVPLKAIPINGDDSIVTLDCDEEEHGMISDALKRGILTCKWGIKEGDEAPIIWQTSQIDSMLVSIPDSLRSVSVYLKWQHSGIPESDPLEICVLRAHIYGDNISSIRVGEDNSIIYVNSSFPLSGTIRSEYGHLCLCFCATVEAGVPSITSINVGSHFFPVNGTKYNIIRDRFGNIIIRQRIHIFDVLYNEDFQDSFLYNPHFVNHGACTLDIILNSTDGPFQRTQILCNRYNYVH